MICVTYTKIKQKTKDELFVETMGVIASEFENSFQKLEKIITENAKYHGLPFKLFEPKIMNQLLQINESNDNESSVNKDVILFRLHVIYINCVVSFVKECKHSIQQTQGTHLHHVFFPIFLDCFVLFCSVFYVTKQKIRHYFY